MTKQNFEQLKEKEAQIQKLKQQLQNIESGKILTLSMRIFSADKKTYEHLEIADFPKKQVRLVLLENLNNRLEAAKADWESYFDDKNMFER